MMCYCRNTLITTGLSGNFIRIGPEDMLSTVRLGATSASVVLHVCAVYPFNPALVCSPKHSSKHAGDEVAAVDC